MADKDEKAARLAAALKENLRRRKAQARAVGDDQRQRNDAAIAAAAVPVE